MTNTNGENKTVSNSPNPSCNSLIFFNLRQAYIGLLWASKFLRRFHQHRENDLFKMWTIVDDRGP